MPAPKLDILIETALSGPQLLADSFLNKGSAFPADERNTFNLTGLLPLHVSTMDDQLRRTYENFSSKETPLEKYIFLAALQDRNETLFYKLVQTHIREMVPILYTPTVGEACQKYSHIFRRARGLYLSYPDPNKLPHILRECAPDDIEVIVVTDGERILGLGDLGVGGMGIPIGKLSLYTLCAGIHPRKTLPVILDVGTNNPALLEDPLYLGWRHPRLDVAEYDHFIDLFVAAVKERWPHVILQWEDFSKNNAWRLLERYRDELATFNDDIQGTAAVTVAGLLRATHVAGRTLKDERIVILGAGSAATGIAALIREALHQEGVSAEEAKSAIWLIDTRGLVHEGRTDLSEEKTPYAQPLAHLKEVGLDGKARIDLLEVVQKVKPTSLIGTSGQPGVFNEPLVRSMAAAVKRPIIFPLSNPTSKCEALPEDLMRWTDGQALVATGSPFPAVTWKGHRIPIGQCNNAFVFPGVGLGLISARARRVPNEVFLTAAKTLAQFEKRQPGEEECLFPSLENVREISEQIAMAVAKHIVRLKLSYEVIAEESIPQRVGREMWSPEYAKLIRKKG